MPDNQKNPAANVDPDHAIRQAAFEAMEVLGRQYEYVVPWYEIQKGFEFQGVNVKFASRAIGIFKPEAMRTPLSIRSSSPRRGRPTLYSDQGLGLLDRKSGLLRYDFQQGGLDRPANRSLLQAIDINAPLLYFFGVGESYYQPLFPVWASRLDDHSVGIAVADHEYHSLDPRKAVEMETQRTGVLEIGDSIPRDYFDVQVTKRRHQALFAKRVKLAYGECCAFTGLPLRSLLDAAHIIPDSAGGLASVNNGICMSRLHHAAFDSFLIGVDKEYRIHVSNSVLDRHDGNLLRDLKDLNNKELRLPKDANAYPNPDYLETRFSEFLHRNTP